MREEARGLAELAVEKGKTETPLPGGFVVTRFPGESGPQLCGLVSPAFIGGDSAGGGEGGETSPPAPAYSLNFDHAAHGHPEYPGEAALTHFAEWAPKIRAFLNHAERDIAADG
jgi:hypothetical protein